MPQPWIHLAWLAAAGALGTVARYAVTGLAQKIGGPAFPWGTLAVNAAGCLLFGLVWALAQGRLVIDSHTRFIILFGFMGAFTTFSAFAFETAELLRDSQWWLAIANVAGQNLIGLVALIIGMALGRWF